MSIVAIVLSLVVGALAIAALVKPAPKAEAPAAKVYSEQEVADAKKAVCDAYGTAIHTLDVNKRKSSVNPADSFAVAVNTRLTVETVADYLTQVADAYPAPQPDLTSNVNNLASAYRDIVLKQIGDAVQTELDASYQQADKAQTAVAQLCK
ncbi:hypothetical protein FHT44_000677 [Mycolicibacterium sp. BK634]|uniref:hypothetical protein n=1 Tax=Mycolicibacterium sp. BK634 TaxID=2587099 RepID=UPI0016087268|nr:hypothetical protein [Mycolicibacterium sp. BK634]MBB3748216.1 hypothetical protein [Mycolicibacterium sp. BK634]